jgi:hypothetical protein
MYVCLDCITYSFFVHCTYVALSVSLTLAFSLDHTLSSSSLLSPTFTPSLVHLPPAPLSLHRQNHLLLRSRLSFSEALPCHSILLTIHPLKLCTVQSGSPSHVALCLLLSSCLPTLVYCLFLPHVPSL